ncbi:MAG: hypothetical protein NUV81_02235 [bacterium]|nr:hypothetical protein [bacterium]
MKEMPSLTPDPERFGQTKGRQIDLPVHSERFSHLEEGIDYSIVKKNDAVVANRKLQDFMVFVNPSEGKISKDVYPPHWRTISDSNITATTTVKYNTDKGWVEEQVPFYTANTKGVGFLKPTAEGISLEDYETWTRKDPFGEHDFGYQILGLSSKMDYMSFGDILQKSQFLQNSGLRTECFWGIAKLNNVYFQGKKVSIDELRKKEVIPKRKDYQPHMAVRLLKTNHRVQELESVTEERREALFEHAFHVFNQESKDRELDFPELSIKNPKHQEIFLSEFFRRMGENMGVLIHIGYNHYRSHSANVSLAAEMVDIGTVGSWRTEKKSQSVSKKYDGVRRAHLKDMRDVAYTLRSLLKSARLQGFQIQKKKEWINLFIDGMKNKMNFERIRDIEKTDPEKAIQWMSAILNAVIVERKSLPGLLENDVEDWGLHLS